MSLPERQRAALVVVDVREGLLLEQGAEVHVARDAVGSRHASDLDVGLRKMERAGAIAWTAATAVALREGGGTPEFEAVQQVIK